MTEETGPPEIIKDIVNATNTITGVLLKVGFPLPGTDAIVTQDLLEASLPNAKNMQNVSKAWIKNSTTGAELWIKIQVSAEMVQTLRNRKGVLAEIFKTVAQSGPR